MELSFHIQWLACGFQWSFDGNHKKSPGGVSTPGLSARTEILRWVGPRRGLNRRGVMTGGGGSP